MSYQLTGCEKWQWRSSFQSFGWVVLGLYIAGGSRWRLEWEVLQGDQACPASNYHFFTHTLSFFWEGDLILFFKFKHGLLRTWVRYKISCNLPWVACNTLSLSIFGKYIASFFENIHSVNLKNIDLFNPPHLLSFLFLLLQPRSPHWYVALSSGMHWVGKANKGQLWLIIVDAF